MYHKINLPDCADQLLRLTELARHAITFSLEHDASIADDYDWDGRKQPGLGKSLGDAFLAAHDGHRLLAAAHDSFLAHFEAIDRQQVGQWLWGKYATVAKPIVQLLVIPLCKKNGISDAFRHDTDLDGMLERPDDKTFHYGGIAQECDKAKQIVKDLMVSLYEAVLVGGSIPSYVIEEENCLDHQAILQSYLHANRDLRVCPGCDGQPPRVSTSASSPSGVRISAEIDHFLPKSKYPFLALHPLNLVPLCLICNKQRKRDKDAFAAPGVSGLDDIYHPYIRGAHGEVQVVVERDDHEQRPHIRLRTANDDARLQARLNSLEHVLGLQRDWDGDLQEKRLDGRIHEVLLMVTQDERAADERQDDQWLRGKLAELTNAMERNITSFPHTVAAQAYARWLSTDDQAGSERLRLYNRALGLRVGAVNPSQPQLRFRKLQSRPHEAGEQGNQTVE